MFFSVVFSAKFLDNVSSRCLRCVFAMMIVAAVITGLLVVHKYKKYSMLIQMGKSNPSKCDENNRKKITYRKNTSALKDLHWLPIRQRIEYKLCLLVYLSINDRAPCYLRDKLTFVSDRPGRASLRSAQTRNLDVP